MGMYYSDAERMWKLQFGTAQQPFVTIYALGTLFDRR